MLLQLRPNLRLEGGNWVGNGKIAFRYAELSAGLGGGSRWQVEVVHLSTMFSYPEIAHDGMSDSAPRKNRAKQKHNCHRSTHPNYRQGKRMTFIFSQR